MFGRNQKMIATDFFKRIFEKYNSIMFSFICHKIARREDALNVLQDALVHLWSYRNKLDSRRAESIVFKACRQEIFRFYKERGLPSVSIDHAAFALIDHSEEDLELKLEKERMLDRLFETLDLVPEKRKNIFIQHKLEGKTEKEIAREMNMSRSAIENQIAKTILFLKRKLR